METENPNIKATKLEIKYVLESWTKIYAQYDKELSLI